jgi:SCP-2 sterol transfer family
VLLLVEPVGEIGKGAVLRAAEDVVMRAVQRRLRRRWFADLKAEVLGWWVRTRSDQRLQSVMRSRLRNVLLWQIFRTIGQRAQPDTRLDAVVEFRITGRRDGGIDRYQLTLSEGRCRASRCGGGSPAVTLTLEPVSFLRLAGGTASAQRLLIAGKLKLRGDLVLALALPAALRLPRRRPRASSSTR